jgi:pimeloyl-ACP methyl ester carboxylesterase
VILVGHSWGGAVITAAGDDDKVKALVYVAAYAPDVGESVSELGRGPNPPPFVKELIVDSGGFASMPAATMARYFAPDLPAADVKLIFAKQGPIATRSFDDELPAAAWRTRPSWYLRASRDQIIDPGKQAEMAARIQATVRSVAASHVAMLSRPRDVAEIIVAAARAVRGATTPPR